MLKLISQQQLNPAKLYSTKFDFINDIPKKARILEIGTMGGDYAKELIDRANPASIDLVDTFCASDWHGMSRFTPQTHLEYINKKFEEYRIVTAHKGDSTKILPTLNKQFDYIYIDANHDYYHAKADLLNSVNLISRGGIIGLNDYISYDHINHIEYGVIEAVCEFLDKNKDWNVIGFALQENMYCDIYIKSP
jgi:hypothetical protein